MLRQLLIVVVSIIVATSHSFKREYIKGREAVGVYDDNGESMYAVILHKDDTYQAVMDRHMGFIMQEVCRHNAFDSDMEMLGVQPQMKGAAVASTSCLPDDVHFSASWQYKYGYETCLSQGEVVVSNKKTEWKYPSLHSQDYKNPSNVTQDVTFTMEGVFTQSIFQQTTQPSEFKVTSQMSLKGLEEQIEIDCSVFNLDTTISVKDTTLHSDSKKLQMNQNIDVKVPAGKCYKVSLDAVTRSFSADYSVEIKPSNYFGANYNSPCNGHHFYFLPLSDLSLKDIARYVKGNMHGVVAVDESPSVKEC